MTDNQTIKQRILLALESTGHSQRDLAKVLGLTSPTVSGMLRRKGAPTLKYVRAAAELTGYSEEWLLKGEGIVNEPEERYGGSQLIKDPLIKLMLDKLNDQEKRLKELEDEREKFLANIEKVAIERAKELLRKKGEKPE